jgi:hypothetical protein
MLKVKLLLLVFVCAWQLQVVAQDIDARLGVDSNEVSIGDHIHLSTTITYPTDQYAIVFPNINELYTSPFTIIAQSKIDTSQTARTTTLQQTTTITCYDSGLYVLPKLHINGFNTSNDSAIDLVTDSVFIKVNAVPVNVNGDIKDIITPKQSINYWKPIAIGIGVLALLFFAIYFGIKYFTRYKNKPIPPIDPYQKTMSALLQLQQMPINNLQDAKHFYSTITEECKYYLHTRLQMPVLDKTTLQIQDVLLANPKTASIANTITPILQLADLVKFAKQSTSTNQNTNALQQAIAVVQSLEQHYQTQLLQQAAKPNE